MNICLRGERRSAGAAVETDTCWAMMVEAAEGSKGGPKMMVWSSTKEEMRGAGTLRVGAKTMPTVEFSQYAEVVCSRSGAKRGLTIADVHLVNVGIVHNRQEESRQRIKQRAVRAR